MGAETLKIWNALNVVGQRPLLCQRQVMIRQRGINDTLRTEIINGRITSASKVPSRQTANCQADAEYLKF
jgi:hypothetical protein